MSHSSRREILILFSLFCFSGLCPLSFPWQVCSGLDPSVGGLPVSLWYQTESNGGESLWYFKTAKVIVMSREPPNFVTLCLFYGWMLCLFYLTSVHGTVTIGQAHIPVWKMPGVVCRSSPGKRRHYSATSGAVLWWFTLLWCSWPP